MVSNARSSDILGTALYKTIPTLKLVLTDTEHRAESSTYYAGLRWLDEDTTDVVAGATFRGARKFEQFKHHPHRADAPRRKDPKENWRITPTRIIN